MTSAAGFWRAVKFVVRVDIAAAVLVATGLFAWLQWH